jgi:hypothetical protein
MSCGSVINKIGTTIFYVERVLILASFVILDPYLKFKRATGTTVSVDVSDFETIGTGNCSADPRDS